MNCSNHPDRKVRARGLCTACYERQRLSEEFQAVELYTYDPLSADALAQGYPVIGATRGDYCAAVQILARRGVTNVDIAARLRLQERQVERFRTDELEPDSSDYQHITPTVPAPECSGNGGTWPACNCRVHSYTDKASLYNRERCS